MSPPQQTLIMIKLNIAAAAIALTCSAAYGQARLDPEVERLVAAMEGTIFVIPHVDSVEGKLRGCGLEFAALKRDFSTKAGAPVKLSGSFYMRPLGSDGLGYMLKLGLFDGLDPKSPGVAPHNAFVRAVGTTKAPKRAIRSDSDNPAYALFVGAVDSEVLAAYESILEKKELVVGFNRKAGQQDVVTTIDLSVVNTAMTQEGKVARERDDGPVKSFYACTTDLIGVIRASKR